MPSARPIGPGSIVDVVAPAGPFDRESFEQGLAMLRSRGLVPRHRPDVFERDRFLAGPDARRREELAAAIHAPDSDVIWCARGGYGATRLLPSISREDVRRARKLLVGFSDITALHALWLESGVPSIHGPMIARLPSEAPESRVRVLDLVLHGRAAPLRATPMVRGEAHGRLTGGNLALLAAICGTPSQPRLDGSIVFLEEVGERPYRIDRMLVQCEQAGLFDGVTGLVIGEFLGCDEKDGSVTAREVVLEHLERLRLPTLGGLASGHGATNLALPFGVECRLDAREGTLEFPEPLFEPAQLAV